MSINAINRILQVAYPSAIFLAVLASAGMSVVQAEGTGYHLFPDNKRDQYNPTLASTEMKACSKPDRYMRIKSPLTCSDENGVESLSQINEGRRLVKNTAQEQGSKGLN